ncbi:MAG: cyclic nucleotide-binding domain-containing protein, partial [Bacteroidota bacterium]
MDTVQIKNFLRRIELFRDLNDTDCELLAQNFEFQTYIQNSLIFVENNERKYLYIVTEGEVELYKKTPFGDEKRLTIFSKFDFFGEGAFIDDSPHTTSARATLNTTVLLLSKEK